MRRHQMDADNAAAFIGLVVGLAIITPVIVLLVILWWSLFL